MEAVDKMLASVHLKRVAGVDDSYTMISSACVFHCGAQQTRQIPCMVLVEIDLPSLMHLRVTVATADPTTSDALKSEISKLLAL